MSNPYGGFESARRTNDYEVASETLSEEDKELKKRRMKEDREYDEKKRREFLERQALGREEKPKGKYEKFKEQLSEYAAPVNRAGEKIASKFSEAKENVDVYRASRDVAKFQKTEQKIQHASAVQKAAEIRKYGRELTEEERDRLVQFKIDEAARKAERREKIKERLSNARVQIQELGEQSSSNLNKIGGELKLGGSTQTPFGAVKGNAIGTPAGEATEVKRDVLSEMFSLKGFGGNPELVKPSGGQGGQDPLMSMYSLKGFGGTPQVQQPAQAQGKGAPQQVQAPAKDNLMEFFSLKGLGGDPRDFFMVGLGQNQPQNQPQRVEPKGKRKHKHKKK